MAKVTLRPVVTRKLAAEKAVVVASPRTHVSQVTSPTAAPKVAAVSRKTAYARLVRRLAKDLGVKVAVVPAVSPPNPYRASAAVTKKALQSAGVLTRSGNLSPRLK